MSIAQTMTEVLREHVTPEVESIDRMYLNVYCDTDVMIFLTELCWILSTVSLASIARG